MKKYHIIEKYRKKNIFQAKIQARAFLFYDVAAQLSIILNIYLYQEVTLIKYFLLREFQPCFYNCGVVRKSNEENSAFCISIYLSTSISINLSISIYIQYIYYTYILCRIYVLFIISKVWWNKILLVAYYFDISIYLSLTISTSISLYLYLSVYLSIYLSIYLSTCLSISLSLSLYI